MFKRKYLGLAAVLLSVIGFRIASAINWNSLISDQQSYFEQVQVKPDKGQSYTDKVFGTTVKRLTDSKADGINGMVPDYSKRQAWNMDGSLMMLRDADGNAYLFDGKTYAFMKKLDGVGGEDVFWSPTVTNEIWYNDGNTFTKYNVDSGVSSPIFQFSDYDFADTKGEGNLSRDGHYYAVAGQTYNQTTGETTYKDLVLLDVTAKKIVNKLALPAVLDGFDWVSVSPLGNYIVVDYANDGTTAFHGVEVYDRNFKLQWRKPIGAGHSDLGVDENGKEFLMMDYYNSDSNVTQIKKFDLASGTETVLLELSPVFDMHESCRNSQLPGWCLVSTFDYVQKLTASSGDWLPFENEVFLLKTDGSKTVKRLAHHYSRRYSPATPDSDTSNYFAEPHATISPDGSKVIFASNWEQDIGATNSVDTYLIDLGSTQSAANPPLASPSPPAPAPAPSPSPVSGQIFTDVQAGDVGSDAIQYLKDNQIVAGYSDGSFRPDQPINRAEFVKIVVGMVLKKSGALLDSDFSLNGIAFSDAENGQWYIPYLRKAVSSMLIAGYPDGTFQPAKQISFVEAAKILVVAKGTAATSSSIWYEPYVNVLKQYNAVPSSVTQMGQQITRREMAEMIYLLNK